LLSAALATLGVEKAKLEAAYKGAKKLQISFDKPHYRRANLLQVGRALIARDLPAHNSVFRRYFLEGKADAYLVTEVLVSSSITVEAFKDKESAVELNASAVAQLANAKVTTKSSHEQAGTVTYEGTQPVTFAFKAVPIIIENGMWTVEGIKAELTLSDRETPLAPEVKPLDPERLTILS
jgi:hypothetical protein